jgi:hypothetical protein
MASKLKSLRSLGAFDGKKYTKEIPRDVPLKKCDHKSVFIMGGNRLRCKCGVNWTGSNIMELYKGLKK